MMNISINEVESNEVKEEEEKLFHINREWARNEGTM
jgi:hypothetical protein